MKAKRKIDQKAIKQFFIDHTEKFVIGLVGLLFAYFAYQAFTIEHVPPHKAEDLQKITQQASDRMKAGPPPGGPKAPETVEPIPQYAKMIEGFKEPIPTEMAMVPKDWEGWFRRPFAPPKLRETPKIFAAEGLRAKAGRGALAAGGGAAGGAGNAAVTVGQRWVVVTGLVPYKKQVDEYVAQFSGAASTDNMTPHYIGFLVERVEVGPGAQGEKKITRSTDAFTKPFVNWRGVAPEVIDPKAFNANLVSPLPPLQYADWNDDVAHPSEIKMLPLGALPGNAGLRGNGGAQGKGPDVGVDAGAMPGRLNPGGANASGPESFTADTDDKPKEEQPKQVAEEVPDYYLIRYFDFDVEPGKQYAYRIFLVLQNPNFKQPDSFLADAEMSHVKLLGLDLKSLKTDDKGAWIAIDTDPRFAEVWSKPCTSPKVPGDLQTLAGPTSPPKVPTPQEMTGEVHILRFDNKTGLNTHGSTPENEPQYRGKWIAGDFKMIPPGGKGTTVPIDTQSILVDLAGGEPLDPKVRDRSVSNLGGGAMIVLDANGSLVIHDEMGEFKEWADSIKEPEKLKIEVPGGRGTIIGPKPPIERGGGPDIDVRRRGGR